MIYILALKSRKGRDLRSTDDLDLMRSWYTYPDAYQREDLDGAVSFALAQFVKKILAKKISCSQVPFDFLSSVRSFLPDLKMTSVKKNVELVRPYLMPFTACL